MGTPIVPAPPPDLPTIKGKKMGLYGDPTTDFHGYYPSTKSSPMHNRGYESFYEKRKRKRRLYSGYTWKNLIGYFMDQPH